MSASACAIRDVRRMGPSKRASSSTALGTSPGLARIRSSSAGLAEEGQEAVADQIERRLVAGHIEDAARAYELFLGEPVASLVGRDHTQEIGLGMAAPLGDQPTEIVGERPLGDPAARHDRRTMRGPDGLQAELDVLRPPLDQVVIIRRDAEQLGDHRHGKRVGEVGEDLHGPRSLDPVEELGDDLLDARPQPRDRA